MKKIYKVETTARFITFVETESSGMAEILVNKTLSQAVRCNKPAGVEKMLFNGVVYSNAQECSKLMDTTNGHSESLVIRINDAYMYANKPFKQIATTLAIRDKEEFVDAVGCNPEDANIDELCYYYCMRVADDRDLETILSFCRR
jgi:hypothetical protein